MSLAIKQNDNPLFGLSESAVSLVEHIGFGGIAALKKVKRRLKKFHDDPSERNRKKLNKCVCQALIGRRS